MGDMVGELFYGVKIKNDVFDKLYKENDGLRWEGKLPLMLNDPYETEQYFLIIRETHEQAYNGFW